MTTLIKNGTVVSSTGADPAEVLIDGETIVAVLQPGSEFAISAQNGVERVIDASGKLVVPGGVDVHTHMELPFGGTVASDDFETGTRAAAWGGTTTIVDFATQSHGLDVRECFDARMEQAEGRCAIDYGFHMIIGDVTDAALKEMDLLVNEGVTSFKLFMAYPGVFYSDDGKILRAMQQCA
ncbi:amidohydrolase family protein, partial [Candidatus Poriferisocius sp.]|uniref:amidohydrolase family protein n=1 Tax=Candidatus Poriferisocius sp. TaxID=3101276 RepID=UPI003B52B7B1